MAMRNSSAVPIKGLTDKRNVTLTFVILLSGSFFGNADHLQGENQCRPARAV